MRKAFWLSGLALAVFGAAVLAGAPAVLKDLAAENPEQAKIASQPAKTAEAEYWLGIGCMPLPAVLRDQLNLPEKQGLLVQAVVPESPAAKAGIVRHDVLMRAGDKLLSEPQDLVQAVEAAKETKLKIELLHGGKSKTVEAAPTKRPPEARRRALVAPAPGDREAMEKWMEELWSGSDGKRPPKSFRFIGPGAIVPRDVLVPVPLPPNMSIAISKSGNEPAKISVKRGEEKWEVTEKEIDKLPADIRPHVERMLGRGPFGVVGDLMPKLNPSGKGEESDVDPWDEPFPGQKGFPNLDSKLFERLEKRFDAMDRQMDNLRKQIEDLNKDREGGNPVEK